MPIGPARNRIGDLETLRPQLRDDGIEVVVEQGEVLALALRRCGKPEEVHLLAAGSDIEPGAREAEIGPLDVLHQTEDVGVEVDRGWNIGDIEGTWSTPSGVTVMAMTL